MPVYALDTRTLKPKGQPAPRDAVGNEGRAVGDRVFEAESGIQQVGNLQARDQSASRKTPADAGIDDRERLVALERACEEFGKVARLMGERSPQHREQARRIEIAHLNG